MLIMKNIRKETKMPEEYDLPYSETVDYMGAQGAYLAPDECRTCYKEDNKIVQNCKKHEY